MESVLISVADPDNFNADPDPAFHVQIRIQLFYFNEDSDPVPHLSDANQYHWSTDPPGVQGSILSLHASTVGVYGSLSVKLILAHFPCSQ